MDNNAIGQPNQARRLLLGRVSLGLMALGVAPATLWGCGGGNGGEQNLPPSIAEGSISGTSLNGAIVALTNITQTNNLSEPVLGRVMLNQQVLPVRLSVSSNIQQAFSLVSMTGNVARYQSTFYDSGLTAHAVETLVTELAEGFLIRVSNGSGSASLMIPRYLVPEAATATVSSDRVRPAALPVILWIVIVVASSWLVAQLIDLAKMALCLAQGGEYSSTIGIVNTPQGQQWGVTSICTKPTGAISP